MTTERLEKMLQDKHKKLLEGQEGKWQREVLTAFSINQYRDGVYHFRMSVVDSEDVVLMFDEMPNELGMRVWDTSAYMANYFLTFHHRIRTFQNRNILELGSGCGLLGCTLTKLGAQRIVLTDRKVLVQHLRNNVLKNLPALGNRRGLIEVQELNWNHAIPDNILSVKFDFIVGSDITVFSSNVPKLVKIFDQFRSYNKNIQIYIGFPGGRDGNALFVDSMKENYLCTTINLENEDFKWRSDRIKILHFTPVQ